MTARKCPNCGGKLGFAKDALIADQLKRGATCGHCKHKIAAGTKLEKFGDGSWVNDGKWF